MCAYGESSVHESTCQSGLPPSQRLQCGAGTLVGRRRRHDPSGGHGPCRFMYARASTTPRESSVCLPVRIIITVVVVAAR